jgi:HD-like signal output (HDOD) protein
VAGTADPSTVAATRDSVRELLAQRIAADALDLPVLSDVAARVIALADSSDSDAAALTRLIVAEPSLAANVMRVAASPIYQPRSPIESLQQAISWLGMAEVSRIALTASVRGDLLKVRGQQQRLQHWWRQAVATALWSSRVAQAAGLKPEPSYLHGLLHEIGTPACLRTVAELTGAAPDVLTDADIVALLGEFGIEVGVRLATSWQLPGGVVHVVRGWQAWQAADEQRDACAVVHLAHQLAAQMLSSPAPIDAERLLQDPVASQLHLGTSQMTGLCSWTEKLRTLAAGY